MDKIDFSKATTEGMSKYEKHIYYNVIHYRIPVVESLTLKDIEDWCAERSVYPNKFKYVGFGRWEDKNSKHGSSINLYIDSEIKIGK